MGKPILCAALLAALTAACGGRSYSTSPLEPLADTVYVVTTKGGA